MSMKKKFDFTGVETYTRAPEGTYPAKVAKIEEVTFQGGNEGFKISFEGTTGLAKGARVIENFPLVSTAMWKLKMFLEACGIKADGRISIDMEKLVGKTVEITVEHEEYEGKTRARIQSIAKLVSKLQDDDEDEDEDDDIEESEDEDEDDEYEDDDSEDEEDEDEEPVKKPAKKAKTAPKAKEKKSAGKSSSKDKKSAKKAKSEPEDDDDWADDWDDEE